MNTTTLNSTTFKLKNDRIEAPELYLGAKLQEKSIKGYKCWTVTSQDYVKAAVKNVEDAIKKTRRRLPTSNIDTPMNVTYSPELDVTDRLVKPAPITKSSAGSGRRAAGSRGLSQRCSRARLEPFQVNRGGSGAGAHDQQLQLADGCPADVKHGPAGSKQDGSGNEDQPCVHGRQETRFGDLKDCSAPPD